ncbi:hypothetical protein niasHT_005429 [Heterodera trifolii]|uniref:JmjC domain-containing protein n=1 Tax=Heterodera trifolii TaxID=157864 RepID=A0ABD2MF61_9BILA
MDSSTTSSIEWDPRDFVEERYPKRSRKNKIDDLSQLDEPEPGAFVNKAERLCKLPYPIEEILDDPAYDQPDTVLTLPVSEFTMEYIKKSGLLRPLLFSVPPEQLGMRMPDPEQFGVSDVLELIGGERRIEVVEVYEQKGTYMLLKDFVDYYKRSPSERTKLLNVLSLEFTNTKLADKIDWIDNVWPKELFARQENLLQRSAWARANDFSTYPKVQRYCLMSVANCFTDFHIDFGGTSVWYHILRGEKIFWMIEPTKHNLNFYEEWILSGNENSTFFGKHTKCSRIRLRQGDTLIIPSGWIHCVYTPVDSLVFGGNFLHSYSIPMQIRVSKSEDRIKIGSKYRFPHFKQMFWCFMAQIVRNATHRIYQKKLPEEAHNIENSTAPSAVAVTAHKNCQSALEEEAKSSEERDDEKVPDDEAAATHDSDASDGEEKAENSAETDVKLADDNDQKVQLNSVGEEICYDELLGNASDGSFTFNPIQSVFENEAEMEFTATQNYDLDYLRSLPSMVVNGLFPLLHFAKRLLKSKQPEVIEGITRPRHLVKEFQALLDKINEVGLVCVQLEVKFAPKFCCESAEFTVPAPIEPPVTLSVKQPPKDDKRKMKRHGAVEETVQKKALKKKNAGTPLTPANGPILVGGLPLSTHLHTPSSSGSFDPMGEIVKLGQKPMQSAWRKASNMAKPPPPTHIHQLKKRFEYSSTTNNNNTIDGGGHHNEADNAFDEFATQQKGTEEGTGQQNMTIADDAAFTTQSTSSFGTFGKERKMGNQRPQRKSIPKVAHNRLIEIHDDSPEFSHRSPLQRLRGQETKTTAHNHFGTNSMHQRSMSHAFTPSNNNNNRGNNQWNNGNFGGDDQWNNRRNTWGNNQRNSANFRGNSQWNNGNSGGNSQWDNGKFGGDNQWNNSKSGGNNNQWNNGKFGGDDPWNSGNNGKFGGDDPWNSGNNQWGSGGFGGQQPYQPPPSEPTSSTFSEFKGTSRNDTFGGNNNQWNTGNNQWGSRGFGDQPPPSRGGFSNQPAPYQQPQQPISSAVNELHHISQIMDAPSSFGLNDEMNIDQIPLPPSTAADQRPFSKFSRFSALGGEQKQRPSSPAASQHQQSANPFADVDELASITRMMQ